MLDTSSGVTDARRHKARRTAAPWAAGADRPDPVPQRLRVDPQARGNLLDRRFRPRLVQRDRIRLELGGGVLHDHNTSISQILKIHYLECPRSGMRAPPSLTQRARPPRRATIHPLETVTFWSVADTPARSPRSGAACARPPEAPCRIGARQEPEPAGASGTNRSPARVAVFEAAPVSSAVSTTGRTKKYFVGEWDRGD